MQHTDELCLHCNLLFELYCNRIFGVTVRRCFIVLPQLVSLRVKRTVGQDYVKQQFIFPYISWILYLKTIKLFQFHQT